jgi:hypothetical protein
MSLAYSPDTLPQGGLHTCSTCAHWHGNGLSVGSTHKKMLRI